jgi:Fuc2NAc and GlcNAc transferase
VGLLDRPNERSSHRIVTPKGGGIGILGAFLMISVVTDLPLFFWLPLSMMACLAFIGDRFEVSPIVRLSAQLALAAVIVWTNSHTELFGAKAIVATLFWILFIVGTANFYNFMDGINGIAGLSGVLGFSLMAIYLESSGTNTPAIMVSWAIALGCFGFLPFNMSEAKVFMGDVGSILLGATFSGLIFLESQNTLDFLCMVSFMFPFYADELITMVERLRDGESLIKPHRRHYYQLMANEKGIAHWKVSVGYGVFQLVVGISVILVRSYGLFTVLAVLTGWFAAFWMESRRVRFQTEKV